jgi:outer membrane protein TolC
MTARILSCFLAGLPLLAGCSASSYQAAADEEGMRIAAEKMAVVEQFREKLVDPRAERAEVERKEAPVEVPPEMTLADAIRIATEHNRDFESRREGFFLTALGLGLTRRDFLSPVFSGNLSYDATKLNGSPLTDVTQLSLTGTQLLPTGANLTVTGSGSLRHFEGPTDLEQSSSITGSFSLNQPLLRGAWHDVAFEGLTQAERNAVYAARAFETFRQTFAIGVIVDFNTLLGLRQGLANSGARVRNQEAALRQAKALYRLQRGTQQDVLRSEQAYRNAENDFLDVQQSYDVSLDRFKIRLGLPLSAEFELVGQIPEPDPLDLDVEAAVGAALHNRLDVATQRDRVADAQRGVMISRNALLPDLDLTLGGSAGTVDANSFNDLGFEFDSVNVGLSLEIPLDRKPERNAYRAALIDLDQSRRSLDELEDNVVLDVRDSLRSLRQQQQQIQNDTDNIVTLERRVLRARLDNLAGRGSNRDIVEAVDELTQAENDLLQRYVTYLNTRLTLVQQLGLLFVDKEGRIVS